MIRSLGFQIGAVVAAIAAAGTWLKLHDTKVANNVTKEIVQRSETQGQKNAEKARKAHDAARKPGAVDRLLRDPASCRDCN